MRKLLKLRRICLNVASAPIPHVLNKTSGVRCKKKRTCVQHGAASTRLLAARVSQKITESWLITFGWVYTFD